MAGRCCWPPRRPRDWRRWAFQHRLATVEACSWKNSEAVVGCGAWGAFPRRALAPKIPGLEGTTRELGSGLLGKPSGSSLLITGSAGSARLLRHCCCTCAGGKKQLCLCFGYCLAGHALECILFSRGKILPLQRCVVMKGFQTSFGYFYNYTEECSKVSPELALGNCLQQTGKMFTDKPCVCG